jgi:hypothetical protein
MNGLIFINCVATDGGGAFKLENLAQNATISNCIFQNNTDPENGGAIYIPGEGDTVKIDNCTFVGNTAYYGAAIHIESYNVIITNTRASNNIVRLFCI